MNRSRLAQLAWADTPGKCLGACFLLLALIVGLEGSRLPAAEADLVKAKTEARKLCQIFPEIYWHASDACLRETSKAGSHPNPKNEFVQAHKTTIEKIAKVGQGERMSVMVRLKLYDPALPEEYWLFDLKTTSGQRWTAQAGVKCLPKGHRLDLFEGDLFMGSMKPYLNRALEAHAEGKDLAKVFPPKESEPKK